MLDLISFRSQKNIRRPDKASAKIVLEFTQCLLDQGVLAIQNRTDKAGGKLL